MIYGSPLSLLISYCDSLTIKRILPVIFSPSPTPTLCSLVTLQPSEEDRFSNISIYVSYELQTPKGWSHHPHPVLDLYSKTSAVFQVTLPTARTRPS